MEQGSILDETLLKDEMQLLEDVAENMWRKIDERIVSLIAPEPEHTLSSWIAQLVHVFEQEVSIARFLLTIPLNIRIFIFYNKGMVSMIRCLVLLQISYLSRL